MKSNANHVSLLGHALPQVDRMVNRLRRCASMARTAGHPWCSLHAERQGPVVETVAAEPVARDALVATVRTAFGTARLAMNPLHWPALASAATLKDDGRRHALITMLVEARLGPLAALVSGFELQAGMAGCVVFAGLALHVEAVRCDILAVDDRLLAAIEAYVAALRPSLSTAALQRRLPSRILLGSRTLPVSRLRNLQAGDVLLLGLHNPPMSSFSGWLSWGERGPGELSAPVLLSGLTMSLNSPPAPGGITGADAGSDVIASTGAALLAQLDLPIGIELSGPLLRLADIADLKAGDVLELPIPIEQAHVRLTVARQALGLGELVAIGGRLGVRILRLDPVAGLGDNKTGGAQ